MMDDVTERQFMARALELAAHGLFTTQPNPRVGCVIVRDGIVVGEGWHERAGEAHAEVHALRMAGDKARGATVFVTLEPCSHHGRTPPCADALVKAGVARVVMACGDPNPKVDGGGVGKLRAAGVQVDVGLLREQGRAINPGFFSRMERGRPWVRLKLAMSLDGHTALANGESKWITGAEARRDVQRWRARCSAIVTGVGTALADDPRLTVRLDEPFEPPLRVVLDSHLQTPVGGHLMGGATPTLLLHQHDVVPSGKPVDHVAYQAVDGTDGRLDLAAVLTELARRRCNEIQVEAGATLAGAWLESGLVDELLVYVAPVLLGEGARPLLALPPLRDMAARRQLRLIEQQRVGDDVRLLLRP